MPACMGQSINLPISAVVVALNERHRISACLKSLSFCREIILCDLGSSDDTAHLASQLGATVINRDRVPIVEMLWEELFALAKNDWVLRFDPDQEFPTELVAPLRELMNSTPPIAVVEFPIQNYFFGKPLEKGVWGGVKFNAFLYRRHS